MQRGGPHGYRVVDVRATLLDGKHHAVDSDEASFKMAGSLALRAAFEQAGATVLEPISVVEVTVPTEAQGDVIGDVNARRGQVTGTEAGSGEVTIHALVPTAELTSYATDVRSMTHGRGHFRATFDRYEAMSEQLVERLADRS